MVIELNIAMGEESNLILAHELMHYLLVLEGALLPVKKKDEIPSKAESLIAYLIKSITHHFILKERLDYAGFSNLQLQFAFNNEVQEMPGNFYHDEEFWLLDSYDRSTFAENYNYENLKRQFEALNLTPVFKLLHNSPKRSVEDINEISEALIREFEYDEFIKLNNLEDYLERKY